MTACIADPKSAGPPPAAMPRPEEASQINRMIVRCKMRNPCHILLFEYHNNNDRYASSKNALVPSLVAAADAARLSRAGILGCPLRQWRRGAGRAGAWRGRALSRALVPAELSRSARGPRE